MKKTFFYAAAAAALLIAVISCNKTDNNGSVNVNTETEYENAIIFSVAGDGIEFGTKAATPVTSMDSFNVLCTSTVDGEVSEAWTSTADFMGETSYRCANYWPVKDMGYTFYCSNAPVKYTDAGPVVEVPDNNTDIVCAYTNKMNWKASPVSLEFLHVFSRITKFEFKAKDGYTVTASSLKLRNMVTSGTYMIPTRSWDVSSSPKTDLDLEVGECDIWLVPGTYTIDATYTLSKGAFSQEFTKSGTISLGSGRTYTVFGRIDNDPATAVSFNVKVISWYDNNGEVML